MAVYFIQAGGPKGPVKIGKADDPLQRLSDLQVGNHETLRLIHAVEGGLDREADIHRKFKPLPGRKEWFHFNPRMLKVPAFEEAQSLSRSEVGRRLDALHQRSRICPGCGCSHSKPGTLHCSPECVELDPLYKPQTGTDHPRGWRCSCCGIVFDQLHGASSRFCPRCDEHDRERRAVMEIRGGLVEAVQ
jgi:hypothetical protein